MVQGQLLGRQDADRKGAAETPIGKDPDPEPKNADPDAHTTTPNRSKASPFAKSSSGVLMYMLKRQQQRTQIHKATHERLKQLCAEEVEKSWSRYVRASMRVSELEGEAAFRWPDRVKRTLL